MRPAQQELLRETLRRAGTAPGEIVGGPDSRVLFGDFGDFRVQGLGFGV